MESIVLLYNTSPSLCAGVLFLLFILSALSIIAIGEAVCKAFKTRQSFYEAVQKHGWPKSNNDLP